MANINKIRLSGTTYNIEDLNATKTVELTQAEYDALPTTAKTSNSLFVITDAQSGDLSNYYTITETDDLLDEKQDTSGMTAYATTATTDALNTVVTAHTADTTIHVTSSDKTAWNGAATNASAAVTALGGLTLVKLTQAQYDALSPNYDSNTLYVIVN